MLTFISMILIADSGSTKTDWYFCIQEQGVIEKRETVGFNPIVQSEGFIRSHIEQEFLADLLAEQSHHIFYFGAGCSSPERQKVIYDILKTVFPNAEIQVNHDMMGAIYATCGDEAGFVGILGTGSNAVFYDGKSIVEPKGSLGIGYILGDEGSGASIGKILLRDFLYQAMPEEILQHFRENLKLTKDVVLDKVYKQPNANTFLASMVKEVAIFRETDYVQDVLRQVFIDFFLYNIQIYPQHKTHPVHFVGSIAAHFEKELKSVAESMNLQIGKIVQKPIDDMVAYYMRTL